MTPHTLWSRQPYISTPAITDQLRLAPVLPTDHPCFPLLLLSALHQTVANFFLAFEQDLALVPVLNKVDLPSADPPAVAAQMASAFDVDPHQVSPPHPGASLSCGTSWHANTTQQCRHTPVTRPTRQANAGCLFPGLILPAADRHTPAPYGPGALPSHADCNSSQEAAVVCATPSTDLMRQDGHANQLLWLHVPAAGVVSVCQDWTGGEGAAARPCGVSHGHGLSVIRQRTLPVLLTYRTVPAAGGTLVCKVAWILLPLACLTPCVLALLCPVLPSRRIPPPSGDAAAPLRLLLFDAFHDDYRGVVCLVKVVDGKLAAGDKLQAASTGKQYEALEVGHTGSACVWRVPGWWLVMAVPCLSCPAACVSAKA